MSDGAASTAPDAAALCTRCGLCCDGTVFENAKVYPEDEPTLARYGIAIDRNGPRSVFRQPCPRLEGCTCTIYAERFVSCRRFRCRLLRRLDGGDITLEQGLATIQAARSLVAAVEPAARTVRQRRALRAATAAWNTLPDPAARTAMARRHFAIATLERFLDRHFRTAKAPPPPA